MAKRGTDHSWEFVKYSGDGLQYQNGNPHRNIYTITARIVELEKNGIRMR